MLKLKLLISLLALTTFAACDMPITQMKDKNSLGDLKFAKATEECDFVFKKMDVCGKIKWVTKASTSEEGVIHVLLTKSDDTLVTWPASYELKMKLWMPHHSHGSAPTEREILKDNSTVQFANLWFIMPGHWDLMFSLVEGDKELDKAILSVHL